MLVSLDVPFSNSPHKCPADNPAGLYALDPKDADVKVNEAVLLSAFLAGRKVSLVLAECAFGLIPRIVSVVMVSSDN